MILSISLKFIYLFFVCLSSQLSGYVPLPILSDSFTFSVVSFKLTKSYEKDKPLRKSTSTGVHTNTISLLYPISMANLTIQVDSMIAPKMSKYKD